MKTSEQINEIAKALCATQQVMRPAIKDSTNPHFKSRYSDLASIWESIRVPLTSNGLTVLQDIVTTEKMVLKDIVVNEKTILKDISTNEKMVEVTTRVMHISGQWIEFGPFSIPLIKVDAQAFGSATSYAKRYALCAALGIVSNDDDDGEKAMGRDLKPEKEMMTTDQAKEIYAILNDCSPEFVESFWEGFKNCSPPVTNLTQVKKSSFAKIKAHVTKNRDEYLATKSQEVVA